MGEAEVIRIDSARSSARGRCGATTINGRPCRNNALESSDYCRIHQSSREAADSPGVPEANDDGEGILEGLTDWLRRRLSGNYPIDDFGYDPELSREILLPLARSLYERYFRVRTLGVDRIPAQGPALLVGNHSGAVPLDAMMVQCAVATEHEAERTVRNVGANLVWSLPFIGPMGRKTGSAVACEEDAMALLKRGELVAVFPEGFKGTGKGWSERYRLQRFGRGGFIEVALRAGVPIVPVAVVGAEEAYPMIANLKLVARALRLPYFPITPTFPWLGPLGLLPLPSRWVIEFGEPIPMDAYPEDAADDKMLVFDLVDSIRDTIQQMLNRNLKLRGGTFL